MAKTRIRSLDTLRVFQAIVKHNSLSRAAEALCLTPSAVSQQLKKLESDLNRKLFNRQKQRLELTYDGEAFFQVVDQALSSINYAVEKTFSDSSQITIGSSTYFSSRWLSSRLTSFMAQNPDIYINLKPMSSLDSLESIGVDVAVLWGKENGPHHLSKKLFDSKMTLMCGTKTFDVIQHNGLESKLSQLRFLDNKETEEAWRDWLDLAGIEDVIPRLQSNSPDHNVRVQGVVDDQGLALCDELLEHEISKGVLFYASPLELSGYGYYLSLPEGYMGSVAVEKFKEWIVSEAEAFKTGVSNTNPSKF